MSIQLLRDIVNLTHNKRNKQDSLQIKQKKLKEFGFDIEDILNIKLRKKINKFEEG